MKIPSLLAVVPLLFSPAVWAGPATVACVGDSITAGSGAPKGWSYPEQLARMLGSDYTVENFGKSGATLMRRGDKPYEKQEAFKGALGAKADTAVIMLGTNDTKPQNWGAHKAEFEPDYRWLVGQLEGTNPNMKIFVCRPCWVAGSGKYGINEAGVEMEIPIIDRVADSMHLGEIDMHAALEGHPEDLPDTVHPNAAGATLMARAAYKAITGREFDGTAPAPSAGVK